MNIFLHICCAPCTIYPLRILREKGFQVKGFFFNPNIHPYTEYLRRRETLSEFAGRVNLSVSFSPEYPIKEFLSGMIAAGEERCRFCYRMRLRTAAVAARREGFSKFTTTLLYSRYQKQDWIREEGVKAAGEEGVEFYYEDFRPGWEEGVRKSKDMGLYRQRYCGCILSEAERFKAPGV
ncbi:MAG TPA: epoxyqueuosine reductase QueH [Syntrophales bacterium]|nr:epoxyqueuosine reductase QueH [Syntrophales bacterium]